MTMLSSGRMEIAMVRRIVFTLAALIWAGSAYAADVSLLNVSYDPTRELYADFNKAFAAAYQKETGKSVEIKQSHGGSGSQARAVIDGLQADIVTLALAYDSDAIAGKGLVAPDWQKRLSILAEPPISVVDKVADKKGTREVAEAYLKFWYTREGQEIAARNSYRPRDSEIAKEYEKSFAKVELFTIDQVFGGWTRAQKEHFAEGGVFDQIRSEEHTSELQSRQYLVCRLLLEKKRQHSTVPLSGAR